MTTQRQEAFATTDTQITEELSLTLTLWRAKASCPLLVRGLSQQLDPWPSCSQHKSQPLPTILRGKRCLLEESWVKGVRIPGQLKKTSWLKLIAVGEHCPLLVPAFRPSWRFRPGLHLNERSVPQIQRLPFGSKESFHWPGFYIRSCDNELPESTRSKANKPDSS